MSKAKTPPTQAKGPGAPRTAGNELPIYDSIQACSSATGIPVSVLKQAKKSGCEAFRHSRVDLGKLLRWLFGKDQDGEGAVNWGERVKKFQALRGELAYERERKESVSRGAIKDASRVIQSVMYSELDQIFCSELPADAKGLAELPLRDKARAAIARLKQALDLKFQSLEGGGE